MSRSFWLGENICLCFFFKNTSQTHVQFLARLLNIYNIIVLCVYLSKNNTYIDWQWQGRTAPPPPQNFINILIYYIIDNFLPPQKENVKSKLDFSYYCIRKLVTSYYPVLTFWNKKKKKNSKIKKNPNFTRNEK